MLHSASAECGIKVSSHADNIIDKIVYDGNKRSQRYESASEALQAARGILPQLRQNTKHSKHNYSGLRKSTAKYCKKH